MPARKIKVFHGLVNYGTQAGFIAKGLRQHGIYARSYVQPDSYLREADFRFYHGGSYLRKLWMHLIYNPLIKIGCMFRYNVFHFYFGTSLLPFQIDLPLLKLMKKKIVHHYLGHDVELYQETKARYEFSNMDFWTDDEKGRKHDRNVKRRLAFESRYSDFQLVCAPQYSPFVPSATFIPLAIDLEKYTYSPLPLRDYSIEPVRIVHAPTNKGVKGTQFLEAAVQRLKEEGYRIELMICQGITHHELMLRYKEADFSVVSLLGGWYGTAAIEAMATGRGVIAFLRPEYFQYVQQGFMEDLPIISADKNSIYEILKNTLHQNENYQAWGLQSRAFVEKYHDMRQVSKNILQIYNRIQST